MRSKPFVVLYLSVLVATMGISMVSPLLPVYAKELGATGIWIGLTFSIFAVTQTLTSPFVGGWSDRFGRKPFIVAGLLLYCIAAIGYLLAEELWQVIAFRALSGGGTRHRHGVGSRGSDRGVHGRAQSWKNGAKSGRSVLHLPPQQYL